MTDFFEKKCIIVCKCKSCLVTFELRHDEISKIEKSEEKEKYTDLTEFETWQKQAQQDYKTKRI